MNEEKKTTTAPTPASAPSSAAPSAAPAQSGAPTHAPRGDRRGGFGGPRGGGRGGRPGGPGGRGRRPSRRDGDDRTPEFGSKTIAVRRVTRVVAGGRRFNFSVALVLGDKKGRVGVGIGKAADVAAAIDKATRNAKKNMIRIATTSTMSIPHEVDAKFASSKVLLFPAPGRGLVAGGSVRSVLDLAGVTDVTGKILSRSKNPLNNARAAVTALQTLHAPKVKKVAAAATPAPAPAVAA